MISLDSRIMYVSSTAQLGVVGSGTKLRFIQRGSRFIAKYSGGNIQRGCLVGKIINETLEWHYLQYEQSGELHSGRSTCEIIEGIDGKVRVIEHFQWQTRPGSGTNVFDELPPEPDINNLVSKLSLETQSKRSLASQ